MTPSVHLSTESEFDQEREPVAIHKDLFESSKGKFNDVSWFTLVSCSNKETSFCVASNV